MLQGIQHCIRHSIARRIIILDMKFSNYSPPLTLLYLMLKRYTVYTALTLTAGGWDGHCRLMVNAYAYIWQARLDTAVPGGQMAIHDSDTNWLGTLFGGIGKVEVLGYDCCNWRLTGQSFLFGLLTILNASTPRLWSLTVFVWLNIGESFPSTGVWVRTEAIFGVVGVSHWLVVFNGELRCW